MGDEELTFKVTDRRHRPEEKDAPPGGRAVPSKPQPVERIPRPDVEREAETGGGLDLAGILAMFATTALVSLGEAADPMTGERRLDLARARDAIDALIVLRQKTEGNRTFQESQLLEGILYDLQVRYVRVAKGGRLP